MTRVGAVTGLAVEARLFGRVIDDDAEDGPMVACAGPGRGRECAEHLFDRGARGLLSFGLAGGLDPWLRPGDLICPDQVLSADGSAVPTDPQWRDRLITEARITGVEISAGALIGYDQPVPDADSKLRLAHASGAVAVDMESHSVAAVAAARGRPFIAVRAVADVADRSVPQAALAAVDAAGEIRGLAVAMALCRSPQQIPAMIALARDTRAAMASLGRAAGLRSLVLGLL